MVKYIECPECGVTEIGLTIKVRYEDEIDCECTGCGHQWSELTPEHLQLKEGDMVKVLYPKSQQHEGEVLELNDDEVIIRYSTTMKVPRGWIRKLPDNKEGWACPRCGFENTPNVRACGQCREARPDKKENNSDA